MLDVTGDLWTYRPADVRCITTNGFVKANGRAVMGRGCALEAKNMFRGLDLLLGRAIAKEGNHVYLLDLPSGVTVGTPLIVTFPVKHRWDQPADIALIRRSCLELVELTNAMGWHNVIVPRPGCGNGQLDYWKTVRPAIVKLLDDRFQVISKDMR